MLKLEEITKQFGWGISILTAYLRYNNKINYTDINILSEGFTRDLLNILFDFNLKTAKRQNSPVSCVKIPFSKFKSSSRAYTKYSK